MATIVTEFVWLLGLMKELQVEIKQPVRIFTDANCCQPSVP